MRKEARRWLVLGISAVLGSVLFPFRVQAWP